MPLGRNACRGLVYRYLLKEGWLPPDTTDETWDKVTVGQLLIDDPPLPTDPDFQKLRVSLDLRALFHVLDSKLEDPFPQLKNRALTLGAFADWCYEHNT